MSINNTWKAIFDEKNLHKYNFSKNGPYEITAKEIKAIAREAQSKHTNTEFKIEPRILCYHTNRNQQPEIFKQKNLFILPVKNGTYNIIAGEGYVDIPQPNIEDCISHHPKTPFKLETALMGNSEMRYLDYAFATRMIHAFTKDPSLILTIRGRRRPPKEFNFRTANSSRHNFTVKSVQVEVDAGYEGKDQVVLVEGKNNKADNNFS